jgi:cell division protein FtsL
MQNNDINELTEELERFQAEKEKIRRIVGQVGGKGSGRRERIITAIFIVMLALLFVADVARHLLDIDVPLPPLFSLEIGVLLVSIKIIWMIHNQTRVEHFQFWILNSIEFRIDQMSNRLSDLEKRIKEQSQQTPPVAGS